MKYAILIVVGILAASPAWSAAALAAAPAAAHVAAPTAAPTASAVLAELKAGNQRHAKAQYTHPHVTAARRQELARGQEPRAETDGDWLKTADKADTIRLWKHSRSGHVPTFDYQAALDWALHNQ